ncbi:hypothetical protein BD626DRAFT_539069 [Schizophyllum amplum]|uniref:Uncharacterized protein n=1 Tax=Schizophyllum amplum TaxID=97359 RepID=A0A550C4U8_9AGAR|nr:hypothetical protein BD626DRAFT_539069 [Auriculariopsis ampla]
MRERERRKERRDVDTRDPDDLLQLDRSTKPLKALPRLDRRRDFSRPTFTDPLASGGMSGEGAPSDDASGNGQHMRIQDELELDAKAQDLTPKYGERLSLNFDLKKLIALSARILLLSAKLTAYRSKDINEAVFRATEYWIFMDQESAKWKEDLKTHAEMDAGFTFACDRDKSMYGPPTVTQVRVLEPNKVPDWMVKLDDAAKTVLKLLESRLTSGSTRAPKRKRTAGRCICSSHRPQRGPWHVNDGRSESLPVVRISAGYSRVTT